MKSSIKFSHFELFKVLINTVYITSGLIMLAIWYVNVSMYYDSPMVIQKEIQCENCDEID